MKKIIYQIGVNSYLRLGNVVTVFLALGVGFLIASLEDLRFLMQDKYSYAGFFGFIFLFYFLVVEYGAIKLLGKNDSPLRKWNFGQSVLGIFVLRLFLLLAGGWFVFIQYQLSGLFSYLVLSILVGFFVGGIFETFRLLKRSK